MPHDPRSVPGSDIYGRLGGTAFQPVYILSVTRPLYPVNPCEPLLNTFLQGIRLPPRSESVIGSYGETLWVSVTRKQNFLHDFRPIDAER